MPWPWLVHATHPRFDQAQTDTNPRRRHQKDPPPRAGQRLGGTGMKLCDFSNMIGRKAVPKWIQKFCLFIHFGFNQSSV